jgi:hypothetical protein
MAIKSEKINYRKWTDQVSHAGNSESGEFVLLERPSAELVGRSKKQMRQEMVTNNRDKKSRDGILEECDRTWKSPSTAGAT